MEQRKVNVRIANRADAFYDANRPVEVVLTATGGQSQIIPLSYFEATKLAEALQAVREGALTA